MLRIVASTILTASLAIACSVDETGREEETASAIQALDGYALTNVPATVPSGSALPVTFEAPPGHAATDWVGLYPVGGNVASYQSWAYVGAGTSGTVSLGIPATAAGAFEVRYMLSTGGVVAATSTTFTVSQSSIVDATTSYPSPGTDVDVAWSAPAGHSATDWIGLAFAGAPDGNVITYAYAGAATSGVARLTVPMTALPGEALEARYFLNNGYQRAATDLFEVGNLVVAPAEPVSGTSFIATWGAPATHATTDWIGVYRPAAADGDILSYQYVGAAGATTGTLNLTLPASVLPGDALELRYFRNNTYERIGKSTIFKKGVGLTTPGGVLSPGGTIRTTWTTNAAHATTDWIGLFRVGASNTAIESFVYVGSAGQSSGTATLAYPAAASDGQPFELRYFTDNTYTLAGRSGSFVAGASYTVAAPTLGVPPGALIHVGWTAPAGHSSLDWMGLYQVGAPASDLRAWVALASSSTSGTADLRVPAASSLGNYELRLFTNYTYNLVATSRPFQVTNVGTGATDGTACTTGSECLSGYCTDGVCCENACGGFCQACSNSLTANNDGRCRPVRDATDPDGDCQDQGAASCGTNGLCATTDATHLRCATYPSGTTCALTTCAAGVVTDQSYCGQGTCNPGTATSCPTGACAANGYQCAGCQSSSDCGAGRYCFQNVCLDQRANGEVCDLSSSQQCASLHCEGTCCAVTCAGVCNICGGDGASCAPAPTTSRGDHNGCAGGTFCNGAGQCSGRQLTIAIDEVDDPANDPIPPTIPMGQVTAWGFRRRKAVPIDYAHTGILPVVPSKIDIRYTSPKTDIFMPTAPSSHYSPGKVAIAQDVDGSTATAFHPDALTFKHWVTTYPGNAAGGPDLVVLRSDMANTYLWHRVYGDASVSATPAAQAQRMVIDDDGNLIVVGHLMRTVDFGGGPLTKTTEEQDVFVLKLDPDGNHVWSKRFGDDATRAETIAGVGVDGAGNVVVAGTFQDTIAFGGAALTSAGGFDLFVARLDGDTGAELQSASFGSAGDETARSLGVAPDDAVVLAASGSADFGAGVLSPHFLVLLEPSFAQRWARTFIVPYVASVNDANGFIAVGALVGSSTQQDLGGGALGTVQGVARPIVVGSYAPDGAYLFASMPTIDRASGNPFCGTSDIASLDDGGVYVAIACRGYYGGGSNRTFNATIEYAR